MNDQADSSCVLLADRQSLVIEAVRDLLKTQFDTLYIVSDDGSLREGARRLQPPAIVLDLSISEGNAASLLRALRQLRCGARWA